MIRQTTISLPAVWTRIRSRSRISDLTPLLLVLLCLAVYLPGFDWGIPYASGDDRVHAWGNDDLIPLAPLAEMHNTFIVAKPDRNIAYPWFQYFLLAAVYSPVLAYLYFNGELAGAGDAYPFGLSDPVTVFRYLSWSGRPVILLLAMATVLGAYYTGKHLWNRRTGLLTAIFVMLMFPMAYYAKLGNLDVPVLGWTSLGLAVSALSLRKGLTVRRGAWLGVFVALAAATKDQAAGSFIFLVPLLLVLQLVRGKADRLWRWEGKWAGLAGSAVAFLVTYILASGIPIDPDRYVQHIAKVFTAGTQAIYLRYPATSSGYMDQATDLFFHLVDVMGIPLVIAAGLGVLLAIRKDRLALAMLLPAVGFFLMLLPVRFSRIHYLLPVALPLMPFAAYVFDKALSKGRNLRVVALIFLIGAVGYKLLQSADLTHAMINDSRYAAGSWLDEHMQPGDRLMYFGAGLTLPHLREGIETIPVTFRDQAMASIAEETPEFIIVIPLDFNENRHRVEWREGPYSIYPDYLPADVFERLVDGSLGYRLTARFQTPRFLPWVYRPYLSYATVNPPIHIFTREDLAQGMPRLEPWLTAPYNPPVRRVNEPLPSELGLTQ